MGTPAARLARRLVVFATGLAPLPLAPRNTRAAEPAERDRADLVHRLGLDLDRHRRPGADDERQETPIPVARRPPAGEHQTSKREIPPGPAAGVFAPLGGGSRCEHLGPVVLDVAEA